MTKSKFRPGIIIQARLKSSRLPNKVLREINGKTLIDIIIERCKATKLPTVVAIPTSDHLLASMIDDETPIFRGSENDVVSRYYHCAKKFKFDPVIRVCADSKMIKPELITQQLENYKKYNHFMYGNFCEVFSFKQLKDYFLHDKRPETREHVSFGMMQDMTVNYEVDLK